MFIYSYCLVLTSWKSQRAVTAGGESFQGKFGIVSRISYSVSLTDFFDFWKKVKEGEDICQSSPELIYPCNWGVTWRRTINNLSPLWPKEGGKRDNSEHQGQMGDWHRGCKCLPLTQRSPMQWKTLVSWPVDGGSTGEINRKGSKDGTEYSCSLLLSLQWYSGKSKGFHPCELFL